VKLRYEELGNNLFVTSIIENVKIIVLSLGNLKMLFSICRANFKKRVCKVVAVLAILSYLSGKLNSVGRQNMFHLDNASCAALLIIS
jgi:hypothetical protein